MALPEIKITNSLTGKKEVFVPADPKRVTFYSCGPTPYGMLHIGNIRAAMTSDLIARTLRKFGYSVVFVRNYTDVDDRIIQQAIDQKVDSRVVSEKFVAEAEKDYAAAGLADPDHKPKVTEFVPEIVEMIERIIANGKAYTAKDGEVFFSIADFPEYGKLSRRNLDDLIAGARVEVNANKRSPADFSLWKPAKPGEPSWPSPWAAGRPGWHIECSAMASKLLGDQIDLHHGGSDLMFPHHENEVAQSEAACGKSPYVKVWVHNAMLNIQAVKMSKSIGNVIQARDFLTKYGGEVARLFILSVHYRSVADFSDEAIDSTLTSLHRIYEAKKLAEGLRGLKAALPDPRAETVWMDFLAECQLARQEIRDQMANDFSSPAALGAIFTLIRAFNRALAEPRASVTPSAVLAAEEFIRVLEDELGGFLGIGRQSADAILSRINDIRSSRSASLGNSRLSTGEIEQWIQDRADARKAKNFAEGDRIRKELEANGVVIKDTPQGTTWEYK